MKKKYRIGEVAKIKDIDAQTLRYYDKLGLLSPEIIDKSNGYRYYSIEQFMDVDCIKFFRMIGFSLKEMKEFKEITDIDESLNILKSKKDIFKEEIRRKQAILKNMEIIIQGIEDKRNLYKINGSNIEIKECEDIYGVIGECKTANDWFEIEVLLEVTQSNASRHLNKLKRVGIISSSKDAQWVHYKASEKFEVENELLFKYLKKKFETNDLFQKDLERYHKYKELNLNCQWITDDREKVLNLIK